MENLKALWAHLDTRRRIIAFGAALAVFLAVLALARGAANRDLALLYAGLDPAAAGGVVAVLDQRAIQYEIRGDAIYVPVADRDSLRLSLAAEGLPESQTRGYELLDTLSGFGTTSQMFDAAYWRAKEGELARTILAVPGIISARVHISAPESRPFARQQTATAAVTVTMAGGRSLSAEQARALRYLIASAVAGLGPDNVAVIDADGGLIAAESTATAMDARGEDLRQRALRLLEARVGIGNAVVEVSVETVTETESILERRIDPESRTAISTQVEERETNSRNSGPGAVSVASNLPDGDAAGTDQGSQSADSETRTTTNYELSETSREILRGPGAIRRLGVAVLVNDVTTVAPDGTLSQTTRSTEELAALTELVASAVGFDATRGDVITLRSMPFEPLALSGTEATSAAIPLDSMAMIRIAALALVALILGLFVLRPIFSSRNRSAPLELAAPDLALARPVDITPQDVLEGQVEDVPPVDPVTRLRRLIESRQDETIQILHDWIDDPARKERA